MRNLEEKLEFNFAKFFCEVTPEKLEIAISSFFEVTSQKYFAKLLEKNSGLIYQVFFTRDLRIIGGKKTQDT